MKNNRLSFKFLFFPSDFIFILFFFFYKTANFILNQTYKQYISEHSLPRLTEEKQKKENAFHKIKIKHLF